MDFEELCNDTEIDIQQTIYKEIRNMMDLGGYKQRKNI